MKIKIKSSALSIFIIFILAGIALAQAPDTVYINVYALNMRSGPGLDFEKTGVLFLNRPLTIQSREQDWLQIQVNDTLSGWVAARYTGAAPITGFERETLLFREGDLNARLRAAARMAEENEGPAFQLLRDYILNHQNYQTDISTDKMIITRIFRQWAKNKITPAVNILIYVMENDLSGNIGSSAEAMAEIRLAAKDALKILVRE